MKPLSEKTYVDQALNNGKGVTWLDNARIPFQNDSDILSPKIERSDKTKGIYGKFAEHKGEVSWEAVEKGRFPANLLVSDDVLNDGKISKSVRSGRGGARNKGDADYHDYNYEDLEIKNYECGYPDSGSFSRYFDLDKWFEKTVENLPEEVKKTFPFLISSKASKAERNQGLDEMPTVRTSVTNFQAESVKYRMEDGVATNPKAKTFSKNFHPTVKPIKLMSYLVTLGSRPDDIVLDPFVGSGTTCIAAKILSRKWIGIEINEGYCKIASARLENCEIVRHGVAKTEEQNIYERYSKDMQEQPQSLIETKKEDVIRTKGICPKCGTKMFKGKRGYYCPKANCDGRTEK